MTPNQTQRLRRIVEGRCRSRRTLAVCVLALLPLQLLFGVARHEGSHVVAVLAAGGSVAKVEILPGGRLTGRTYFRPPASAWGMGLGLIAPYLVATGNALACLPVLRRLRAGLWRTQAFAALAASPLIDTAWNYSGSL